MPGEMLVDPNKFVQLKDNKIVNAEGRQFTVRVKKGGSIRIGCTTTTVEALKHVLHLYEAKHGVVEPEWDTVQEGIE